MSSKKPTTRQLEAVCCVSHFLATCFLNEMKGGISTTPPSDDAENHNAASLAKDGKDRYGGGSSH